jgi:hypothetical protein
MFQFNQANPSSASQKVFFDGAMGVTTQTKILMSQGDEAGVAGGVVSSRFIGPGSISPASGSTKVFLEGKQAVPMGCMTFHNGDASFNTMGQCPMAAQSKVMVGN